MSDKLSKKDMQSAIALVYGEMLRGEEEEDIPKNLGWDEEKYAQVKMAMLESKASELRGVPREHFYVQYVIEQRRNMKALSDLITGLDRKKQYNAMVGAIRLRSELTDKIVDKGMQFGIIKKEPDRKEIFNGILLADVSDKDLKDMILSQNAKLSSLTKKFGDLDIMSMETGDTHYGPTVDVTEESIIDAELDALEKEKEEEKHKPNKKKKKKKKKGKVSNER
ncbi:MAG: hypothetical protein ACFFD1_00730 [Candidatus Thorarchaeota archaeon]